MLISFSSRTEHLSTKLKLLANALLTMLLMRFTGQPTPLTGAQQRSTFKEDENHETQECRQEYFLVCSEELLVVLL